MLMVTVRRSAPLCLLLAAVGTNSACTKAYQRDAEVVRLTQQGDFGLARELADRRSTRRTDDRSYMLDRVKVMSLALADGVPEAAEPIADRLYDFLRTQGVNANNGFGAFVFGEGNARIWKGEPFEQAMALAYIATLDGMNGDWGNVRAAANNALFQIQDLSKALGKGEAPKGSTEGNLAQRQQLISGLAKTDEASQRTAKDQSGAAIQESITPQESNFALGYVLKGIASRQLAGAFPGEAEEVAAQLNRIAPSLGQLAAQVQSGSYNTVLVVDYGLSPQKDRGGPDNAISFFRPLMASTNEALRVSVSGRPAAVFPVVTDLNALALDLRWNSLEDVRLAKSYVGTGLMVAGATVAAVSNDSGAQIAGLAILLAGAAMKATAGADTRYIEILPQRTYVALVTLDQPRNTIDLMIDGVPASRLILPDVPAPRPGATQLRYVRLPDQGAPAWATSGRTFFANDELGELGGANFPYILGGRCVRTPNDEVLSSYQRAGFLAGFSLNDLYDLYKEEGILIAGRDDGIPGRHVLEGGSWLFTPRAGTSGYARLYGLDRPPYQPRSARVREAAAAVSQGRPASPVPAAAGPSREPANDAETAPSTARAPDQATTPRPDGGTGGRPAQSSASVWVSPK